MLGLILSIESLLLLLPLSVSLIYSESGSALAFTITAAGALAVGLVITLISRPKNKVIYAKEGFVIVALSWFAVSVVGMIPFLISGEIPSVVDAFFETVSGFTTTGASILTDIESMSHGMLFWRSFTHWIGGMGVIVFIMAVIPSTTDRSIHIMRAEMPGPVVGKLVPKAKETAKILYLIYIVMTVIETVLLLVGGMPLFDSLISTFGTAGTGGFGIKGDSVASYSPYLQWVITVFMLLFGVNFNLYYLLLLKRAKSVLKSEELWCYIGIFLLSSILICGNIMPLCENLSEAIRLSAFQVSSIITTTGYATTDFNTWPILSKSIITCLLFIGACAGSTAGGLKISRLVILFKTVKGNLKKMLHPRSVNSVKFEGKRLDGDTVSGVFNYFAMYAMLFFVIFLLISLNGKFDIETNFTATAACFNNVGPALGAAGPASSYADYDAFSKIMLSIAMLFGRLEIYPVLFLLSPRTWMKK